MKTLKTQTFAKKTSRLGFTLVELIVVITILVILGTIAFTSLTGYSSNARDSDRVTTLKNIESGLDIHQIKSGSYPAPENITGTGVINNTILSSVGTIGDTISQIIRINKIPTDPVTKTHYTYGTDMQKTQYQIAVTLENPIAYNLSPLVQTVYADASLQARVNGNYPGYIKFSSGSEIWIANIPSLLFNNTGSTNLLSTGTYFVVNKQQNLPYKLDDKTVTQNKTPNEIIQAITATPTATLTEVNITGITAETLTGTFTPEVLASFWWDIAKMETAVLGKSTSVAPQTPNSCATEPIYTNATFTIGTPVQPNQEWQWLSNTWSCYYTCGAWKVLDENACVSETCAGTTPDGTAKISNATSFAWGTWNYNPTWAKCSYTCGTWYHTEDSWVTCISDTKNVACGGSNPGATASTLGTSTTNVTWNGSAWNATPNWSHISTVPGVCQYQCRAGYWYNGSTCTQTTAGSYTSTAGTTGQTQCTAGYYCTAGSTSATQTQCPANSWCALGSGSPTSCGGGMVSPAGSTSMGACVARWSQVYTTIGTSTWTAPAGVTSVSVVCVGAGGGGNSSLAGAGGGLGYKNNYTVVPGNSYTVVVGGANGENSYFVSMGVVMGGGAFAWSSAAGGSYVGDGGGNGGSAGISGANYPGGGGAGGYTGAGGAGAPGNQIHNWYNGSGGGGAGGSNNGGGGGVGLYWQGSNGVAPGGVGSGGGVGAGGYPSWVYPASARGAVRIIWPGNTRTFPSTDVGP